jgi:hypothetical protein
MSPLSHIKVAGISLILGPVVTLVCYFYQQLVIYADVEWSNAASWAALSADSGAATVVTAIIIPLALMALVYGILFIANEIRSSGNGGALAAYGVPMLLIGLTGWVLGAGMTMNVANFPEPSAAAEAVSLALSGVNNIAGLFFSIGFAAIFFAMATRDEYNSAIANAAGAIALVAAVLTIIGMVSIDQNEVMTRIVGVTYIIHTVYAIYLGRGLITRE